jgi:Carboxypeptidase regulatory-like domain
MKIIAFILFLVLAISVECDAGTTGVFQGFVLDPAGQPVTHAWVSAVSLSETCTTYTDKRGFFVCLTLPPDVYRVSAQKPGQSAYSPAVRISSDQTTFLVLRSSTWSGCPGFTRAPLAAAPFMSLDVQRTESYPPNAAPPITLPLSPYRRPAGCL